MKPCRLYNLDRQIVEDGQGSTVSDSQQLFFDSFVGHSGTVQTRHDAIEENARQQPWTYITNTTDLFMYSVFADRL